MRARARVITLAITASALALSLPAAAVDALPALIAALRDPKPETRAEARAALVKAGPEAVPALVAEMKNGRQQRIMLAVLERMGPASVSKLIEMLSDQDLRVQAAAALAHVSGPKAAAHVPALLTCLRSPEVANLCGTALIKAAPKAGGHLPAFLAALKDARPDIRAFAAAAIGQIESRPKAAVEPLIAVLKDPEAAVRMGAVAALGRMGKRAQAAVPILKALELDPRSAGVIPSTKGSL